MDKIEKEIKILKTFYVAEDGKEFESKIKCIKYENETLLKTKKSCDNCDYNIDYCGKIRCMYAGDNYNYKLLQSFRRKNGKGCFYHDWIDTAPMCNYPK